jgi:LysR family hydrogen peroxide-inducible transcriptional activator
MRPTLRQLEYIVAVAETGRFSDAAKRLNVSQPSLSTQIADAELHLGAPVFERGRGGAFPTALGHELIRRARYVLRQVEEMKALAGHEGDALTGRIKLGVLPTIGPYLLPRCTSQLHARFPDLRLSIRDEPTNQLVGHLEDGQLDTVVCTAEDLPGAEAALLFQESLWIAVAPDDPLAAKDGPVSLKELADRPLLTLGLGHRLSLIVKDLAYRAGAYVSADYEGNSLDAIRHMAALGAGAAVLPELYLECEARRDEALAFRRIADPAAKREISLLWRPGSPTAENFRQLAEVLREAARSVLSAP